MPRGVVPMPKMMSKLTKPKVESNKQESKR